MKLYHVTHKDRVLSIVQQGLRSEYLAWPLCGHALAEHGQLDLCFGIVAKAHDWRMWDLAVIAFDTTDYDTIPGACCGLHRIHGSVDPEDILEVHQWVSLRAELCPVQGQEGKAYGRLD